jgi:hypothetical protein
MDQWLTGSIDRDLPVARRKSLASVDAFDVSNIRWFHLMDVFGV